MTDLDEILQKFARDIHDLGDMGINQASVVGYIESKIEELETWAKEAIDSKPTAYDFDDRIATLKAQLGEEKT